MPRIPRLLIPDIPTVYHVMSKTALPDFPIQHLEKEFLFNLIRKLSRIYFEFRQWIDFLLLAAATAMMLQAELFNSAIEAICDFLTTKENHKVKVIKDISAAATGICILLWSIILCFESYRVFQLIF